MGLMTNAADFFAKKSFSEEPMTKHSWPARCQCESVCEEMQR